MECLNCGMNVGQRFHGGNRRCNICIGGAYKAWRMQNRVNYLKASRVQASRRSYQRGLGAIMSTKEWVASCPERCVFTGVVFDHRDHDLAPSPDRIDNARGYQIDNVQWTLWGVNLLRGSRKNDEFKKWADEANLDLEMWPAPIRNAIIKQRARDSKK